MGEHFSTQEFAGRPPRVQSVPKTDIEVLNIVIKQRLRKYEAAMAANTANVLESKDLKEMKAAQAAVRRNEKSIALWTAKLLCEHRLDPTQPAIGGHYVRGYLVRCNRCKTTCSRSG